MPDKNPIPRIFTAIADAIDTGAPIDKLEKAYGYKADVLQGIHQYVRQGESQHPAIPKLIERFTPKPQYKYNIDGREKWSSFIDYPVTTDENKPMRQLVTETAKKYGIKPEILYASAMEEGMNTTVRGQAFNPGANVDGFKQLGLDDLQTYVKQGDGIPYTPKNYINEKNRHVKSGTFNNMTDGLAAKAITFNNFREQVKTFLKDNKAETDNEDVIDFMTMQAYNGGAGVLPKYLKKYKKEGLWEGGAFLNKDISGTYDDNQTYVHSRRRYDAARAMRDKKLFD